MEEEGRRKLSDQVLLAHLVLKVFKHIGPGVDATSQPIHVHQFVSKIEPHSVPGPKQFQIQSNKRSITEPRFTQRVSGLVGYFRGQNPGPNWPSRPQGTVYEQVSRYH